MAEYGDTFVSIDGKTVVEFFMIFEGHFSQVACMESWVGSHKGNTARRIYIGDDRFG